MDALTAARRDALGLLRRYLLERVPQTGVRFTDAELDRVESAVHFKTLAAGEFLHRAGEVFRDSAFVARGCLRTYVIDEHGREHIINFAAETWWIADPASAASGTPSQYYFQALENSELLLLDLASHERLTREVPGYAAGYQRGVSRHAAAKDARLVSVMSATAQDRYADFVRTYPSITARVPQHMLASYLGMSPETLSRVRARLARKK